MTRTRDTAAGRPAAPPRPAPPEGVRLIADAELRAFHAALVALPVPDRLRRLLLEAADPVHGPDTPDREAHR